MYPLFRPLLFRLGPETAHGLAFGTLRGTGALARGLGRLTCGRPDSRLALTVAGLELKGPVGLAAGLDKDGLLIRFWGELGFGFVEFGTATALPQPGNPKPRLFRFPEHAAVINRMGFNNKGSEALSKRLGQAQSRRHAGSPPWGANIGKSKVTPLADAVDDYALSAKRCAPVADYLVVNVSSPNTPGLRELQHASWLKDIVDAVVQEAGAVPVFVKLAPDMSFEELDDAVRVAEEAGAKGIIATNTTIARPDGIPDVGAGGLSGRPLTERALEVVRHVAAHTTLPVIAVGGISAPAHVLDALAAGARAVQVYTALIFEGPGLVRRLNRALTAEMDARGCGSVDELAAALRMERS